MMDIFDIVKALGPADRCGARTRSGEPCKNAKMYPAGRCRMHGGKSLGGIASPRFKHGQYSKYLLTRLVSAHAADAAAMRSPHFDAPAVEQPGDSMDIDALIAYWSSPEVQAAGQAALDELLAQPFDLSKLFNLEEDTHAP